MDIICRCLPYLQHISSDFIVACTQCHAFQQYGQHATAGFDLDSDCGSQPKPSTHYCTLLTAQHSSFLVSTISPVTPKFISKGNVCFAPWGLYCAPHILSQSIQNLVESMWTLHGLAQTITLQIDCIVLLLRLQYCLHRLSELFLAPYSESAWILSEQHQFTWTWTNKCSSLSVRVWAETHQHRKIM